MPVLVNDDSTTRAFARRTSCDDHINLVDVVWELSVQTHVENLQVITGSGIEDARCAVAQCGGMLMGWGCLGSSAHTIAKLKVKVCDLKEVKNKSDSWKFTYEVRDQLVGGTV